ncbi:MAG: hypothetical protein KatS3mg076_0023 [Candidatus Binatia bacterium]|nr:MAG: hypothetical protein KatS3mg076_0023 [Candidatus Binatia bacterium]
MKAWIIWGLAIFLYGAFFVWYQGLRRPLTKDEIDTVLESLGRAENASPERLARFRAFLEADDGREFFMVNLIRMNTEKVEDPDSGEPVDPNALLLRYTRPFMRRVLRRAGHPVFFGQAAGGYLEEWGVSEDPGWTTAAVVRYRSRRDLVELVSDPSFPLVHRYKLAAIAGTFAFPAAPAMLFVGPRVWVGLLLALLAVAAHRVFG